jgi:hypothetical protein
VAAKVLPWWMVGGSTIEEKLRDFFRITSEIRDPVERNLLQETKGDAQRKARPFWGIGTLW